MRKAWALIDFGDTIVGQPFETEEAALACRDAMSYLGEMLEIREIDYNDEPLDEDGLELKERLRELLKDTLNFHMSNGIKFYSMSLKERISFMINMLTGTGELVSDSELD